MPNHILIIEDDPDIARIIEAALHDAAFRASCAPSGALGLILARTLKPDLVILDLGLPDFDGAEVARRLKKTTSAPIIVVSAADALARKLELLSNGAKDYVTKPFHPDELLARVRVQLRRKDDGEILRIGALTIALPACQCTYAGQPVSLSPKEFALLVHLARQPRRVFLRDELIQALWKSGRPDGSKVIDVHLSNLRRKLREAGGYSMLRTVHRVGYALHVQEQELEPA